MIQEMTLFGYDAAFRILTILTIVGLGGYTSYRVYQYMNAEYEWLAKEHATAAISSGILLAVVLFFGVFSPWKWVNTPHAQNKYQVDESNWSVELEDLPIPVTTGDRREKARLEAIETSERNRAAYEEQFEEATD